MKPIAAFTLLIISSLIFISCSTENTPVYQLTTSVNPAEAGSVSPAEGQYDEGTEVNITATPTNGWLFDEWQGDLSSSENPAIFMMDSDKNITAFFVKKTYPLTVTIKGEGTVQEEVIQKKSTDYEHGTVVELTAQPSEGWHFTEWTGDTESMENPITITVEDPLGITAIFERNLYDVEILTEGNGSVDVTIISGEKQDNQYEYGTVLELLAQPAEDWRFIQWELDIKSESNPTEVTIDDNKTIRALFGGTNTFYLAENGVTIKCPTAKPGDKGIVDGSEYEAVNRELLEQRIYEEADLSKVCTSLLTDMSYLFSQNQSFNQSINNWDVSNVTDMESMFHYARSFNQPLNNWDVSSVTNMHRMFHWASRFNGEIDNWDVSSVTNMAWMFYIATYFNQPIGGWDVGSVTDMSWMFFLAESFNQPIGNWDVSSVTDMSAIFLGANLFNQPIGDWDVSSVTNMESMLGSDSFNQPISNWNVSRVTNMSDMFGSADSFNQFIGNWDVSNVTDMSLMFEYTDDFNQPINNWDVSSVTDMTNMFARAAKFNQPIQNWDVSNVTSMNGMLRDTDVFNQPIGEWDVSNVTDMTTMFRGAISFNQPIGNWDVSNVIGMQSMFYYALNFNQDIGSWDVSNVIYMSYMFNAAQSFNQDLTSWCVTNFTTEPIWFAKESPLKESNKPIWGTCPD